MRITVVLLSLAAVLLSLAVAPPALAVSPRITFERVVPAQFDLGSGSDVALVHALTDTPALETFLVHFLDQTNSAQFLRLRDARRETATRADRHLAVKRFTCDVFAREAEGSTRDIEGNRVKRPETWAEAVCISRMDVLSSDLKRLATFYGKGEGASKHVDRLTEDEREIALQQAARYAAVDAAERITPRRVREILPLDAAAPAFDEGMSLIEAGRLVEARKWWESRVPLHPRSPNLRFNLAAVCEALGDRPAARRHYVTAAELAPKEMRFRTELRAFDRRMP